jgi:hypothetical protein
MSGCIREIFASNTPRNLKADAWIIAYFKL